MLREARRSMLKNNGKEVSIGLIGGWCRLSYCQQCRTSFRQQNDFIENEATTKYLKLLLSTMGR